MIVVVMGVAGSGKTTVGTMLADALICGFLDADSLHPEANIEAMEDGRPLTDADRAPWLEDVHERMLEAFKAGRGLVVACSALKHTYRQVLGRGVPITWVYLKGDPDLIRSRLDQRVDHFMRSDLLASQLDELEEPADAIVADISQPPGSIVNAILDVLRRKPDVRILDDMDTMSLRAAESAVRIINDAVRRAGRCSLVLSGGSTPMTFHRLLASTFRDQVPWEQVHVFWTDERYVPHESPQSNYRMARNTLLDHVPCPPANIHPMPTHAADPDAAASHYEKTMVRYWGSETPRLDLVLLGMGHEGHTASLFPGAPALRERTRWVVAATVPADPPVRLTLTLPALTRSAHAHFLVSGSDKSNALRQVLSGNADPDLLPAAAVRAQRGPVVWWLDKSAAPPQQEHSRRRSAAPEEE
jgi:6-phosphogluconolactonase